LRVNFVHDRLRLNNKDMLHLHSEDEMLEEDEDVAVDEDFDEDDDADDEDA
jgi:hypothetical protein